MTLCLSSSQRSRIKRFLKALQKLHLNEERRDRGQNVLIQALIIMRKRSEDAGRIHIVRWILEAIFPVYNAIAKSHYNEYLLAVRFKSL